MMSPHHLLCLSFRRRREYFVTFAVFVGLGFALLSLLLASVVSVRAAAHLRAPGGNFANPVVRAVDVAEPAIVRLATLYEGRITLNLCGQGVELPASDHGYTVGGLGSGAFISANGEILTADHIVHIDKVSLDDEILRGQASAPDIARAVNAHASCLGINYRVTPNDIANDYLNYVGISYRTSYSEPRRLVWQVTSYTGPLNGAASDTLRALLKAPYKEASLVTSSAFEQNDLAVLRVALTDTPSIQLDDSSDVAVEDQLTIIGFPRNGDVSNTATDLLTPSVNTVMVSAIKSGPNGAKLIQVGGNVEHGDSGGPALDARGHIVGIVSFGGLDPRGSTAFMRSSNYARTLITSAGLNTQPGVFQKLWEKAFADYTSTEPGHWHKAASELDALSTSYPAFKGIQEYQTFADAAAQTEGDSSTALVSQAGVLIAIAVVGVVALVVVGVVVFFVTRRRRARLAVAPGAVMGQAPYGSMPYGSMPYGSMPYGGYPYASQAGYGSNGGYAPPNAGGYGGYGAYAAPSALAPTNGHSNVSAAGATVSPEAADSSTLQELAAGGPSGRMSLPPSPSAYGAAYGAGASTASTSVGVEAPAAGGVISGSSSPSWAGAQSAGGTVAASDSRCVNGHGMSPHEVYCSVCGAPRRSDFPYSQYASRG